MYKGGSKESGDFLTEKRKKKKADGNLNIILAPASSTVPLCRFTDTQKNIVLMENQSWLGGESMTRGKFYTLLITQRAGGTL